ncbi:MAG TPA: hypothetical protein VFA21_07935 [Pyrinomonadaceae bacterium]|nr:hypothetical protein [Pyrinomonadaceae bacterium]
MIGLVTIILKPKPHERQLAIKVNNNAAEVITIGASSEDIVLKLPPERQEEKEEWRASERAKTIAMWLEGLLNKSIPIRKLNVGHYTAEKDEKDNPDQRRVIIALILKESERCTNNDNSIDGALRDAFTRDAGKHPIYKLILTRYSLSKGDQKLTWVQ